MENKSNETSGQSKATLRSVDKGRIELVAYGPFPLVTTSIIDKYNSSNDIDVQNKLKSIANTVMTRVSEAGFTSALIYSSFQVVDRAIEAIKSNNLDLGIIVYNGTLTTSPVTNKETLDYFEDKDTVEGWMVMDQPQYWDWGDFYMGGNHVWNKLTVGYAMTRALGSPNNLQRRVFFNLGAVHDYEKAGSYSENYLGSVKTYTRYLEVLRMLFRPNLWSYNYYPFLAPVKDSIPETDPSKYTVGYEDFFGFLEKYKNHVAGTDEQFWAFAMVLAHGNVENGVLVNFQPAPTEGMLRFEVMNALAYGAQGIMYYNFGMRKRRDENTEGYKVGTNFSEGTASTVAPIECNPIASGKYNVTFKEPGDLYNSVKKINGEVLSWNNVFYGSKVKKVFQKGQYPKTDKGQTTLEDFPGVQFPGSHEYVYGVTIPKNALGVTISHLVKGTKNYIVFVNHDPFNSQKIVVAHSTKAQFMYHLSPAEAASSAGTDTDSGKISGGAVISPGISVSDTVTLKPGGIAVLSW